MLIGRRGYLESLYASDVTALVCPWYSLTGSALSTCHKRAKWSLEARRGVREIVLIQKDLNIPDTLGLEGVSK